MKKVITLAAAGALAAASLTSQAQVTVDGMLNATEIGTGSGKYQLLGKFTNPRGFGDWGLLSLYAANTNGKVYFFVGGTVENGSNAFQLFVDVPGVSGASASPAALPAGSATSFGGMVAKMDLAPDFALAIKSNGDGSGTPAPAGTLDAQAIIYTSATAAADRSIGTLNGTGAVLAPTATVTAPPFARLSSIRMAYKNTPDGKILSNPGNVVPNTAPLYGAAGSFGWEIELDRAALGIATGAPTLNVFALQNNGGGDYLSTDFIPQSTNAATPAVNLAGAAMVDFASATIGGLQSAAFAFAPLGTKAADEASVAINVFPNPAAGQATVAYLVADRAAPVQVTLTDLMGRTVRTLATGMKAAGTQSLTVSTADVAAGTYLVRVQVGDKVAVRKVVLL